MHYRRQLNELIMRFNAFLNSNQVILSSNLLEDTKVGLIPVKQDGKLVPRAKMVISSCLIWEISRCAVKQKIGVYPKLVPFCSNFGIWYASITVDCIPTRVQTDKCAVGLDFGTHQAVAFSDGIIIDNPRFIKQSQEKVNRLAKKSRRKRAPNFKKRIRPSRRWKKANQAVSKIQSKVARQRQDWQHKVATEIVSSNSFVATEQLNLKNLTRKAKKGSKRKSQKTGLNRNLLDVGIGDLKSLIKYKVTEAGGIYIEIPTRQVAPSQTCPGCGFKRKKDLSERVHTCDCGIEPLDRDVAAAQVMLNYARGMECTSSDAESPSSISCGNMRQLGAKKRQKLVPNL